MQDQNARRPNQGFWKADGYKLGQPDKTSKLVFWKP